MPSRLYPDSEFYPPPTIDRKAAGVLYFSVRYGGAVILLEGWLSGLKRWS